MTKLSDTAIIAGLLSADPSALKSIFQLYRPAVLESVRKAGGTANDGAAFFQAALLEVQKLVIADQFSDEIPFEQQISEIAVQHLHTWQSEQNRAAQAPDPTEAEAAEASTDTASPSIALSDEAIRQTRRHIYAWRTLEGIGKPCREQLLSAEDPALAPCVSQYVLALRPVNDPAPPEMDLPDWATSALQDKRGYQLWQQMQVLEGNATPGVVQSERSAASGVAKYLLVALVCSILGLFVWAWLGRPKPVSKELFSDNYDAPRSILADLGKRYATDSTGTERPVICLEALQMADGLYIQKRFEAAQEPLLVLLDDEQAAACHADASFYLAIIQLEMDNPIGAIDYLSKIDNVEVYGEDLYWYQALAFVKIAIKNPSTRELAIRSLDRCKGNTQSAYRLQRIEEMNKQLR